jgi:hypothetical protein
VCGLVIVAISIPFLARAWRDRDAMRWVMAAVMLDLLLAPRPMSYGFVRLGPAPLFFASSVSPRPWAPLAIAAVFAVQGLARGMKQQYPPFTFLPWILTFLLWVAVLERDRQEARAARAAPSVAA